MHFPEFPSLITHICVFKLSLGEPEKSTAAVNFKRTVDDILEEKFSDPKIG